MSRFRAHASIAAVAAAVALVLLPAPAPAQETYEGIVGRWSLGNGFTIAIDGSNGSYTGTVVRGGSAECHPRAGERVFGRINGSGSTYTGTHLYYNTNTCSRIGYGQADFTLEDSGHSEPSLDVCSTPPGEPDAPPGCQHYTSDDADTDQDGLPDRWELSGINTDRDPQVEVRLKKMGADPLHKDLFIEVDYMPGHRLGSRNLEKISDAFAIAPVDNPDGQGGINLHIDNGPESLMNPRTGETWDNLSGQNRVPHDPVILEGLRDATELFNYRDREMAEARRAAFRYALAADGIKNDQGTNLGATPAGDEGGVVMATGFGGWRGGDIPPLAETGIFMHEVGHMLGLDEGGRDPIELKPTHLSVMNYGIGDRGLRLVGSDEVIFDYSRFDDSVVQPLHEAFLSETAGARAGPSAAIFKSFRFCPGGNHRRVLRFNESVDWDCDGEIEAGTVTASINDDRRHEELRSYNEWQGLALRAGSIGSTARNFKLKRRRHLRDEPSAYQPR